MDLIFLKPYFQEKIWGGNKLHKKYKMPIPSEKTGEAWVASAYPSGLSTVTYPEEFKGLTLDVLYKNYPHIFGPNQIEPFPLLVKIIDAKEDLSVQVHPDDDYAKKYEGSNEYGKNECWYVLAAEEDAKIIYGHHAKTREEFVAHIKKGDFENLLRELPVQKGDFFDVPAGTIHGIGSGVMVLETQQSSDTTYRVYDYDRKDEFGHSRALHLEQAADVTMYPHTDSEDSKRQKIFEENAMTQLVSNDFFTVEKASVTNKLSFETEKNYYLVTIIEGSGSIIFLNKEYSIEKGESFIIPYGKNKVELKGTMELICSSIQRK